MIPDKEFALNLPFRWSLRFWRGRISLDRQVTSIIQLAVYIPWVYYDPEEYDGFAGNNKVFKAEANTIICVTRDPELSFTGVTVKVLGFGAGWSFQKI